MSSTTLKKPEVLSVSKLTPIQTDLIDRMYEREYGLFPLPMGSGKTVMALTAANELITDGELKRVLVLAPLRVCDLTWATESDKWSHLNASVGIATGDETQRRQVLDGDDDIVVINFDNLAWFVKNYGTKRGLGFDGLVVDELTKLKNTGGVWFKALRKYIPSFAWRIGLTGTLTDEGLEHLYSMVMVVDAGLTLGRNKDVFMMEYFYPTDYNRYNWEPKDGAFKRLSDVIRPFTFMMDSEDQHLPHKREQFHVVDIGDAGRVAYKDMAREMAITLDGRDAIAVNAAVLSGKLQQICAGFVYDEDGNAIAVHDAKLLKVLELIKLADSPVMVVYQFTEELERLLDCTFDAAVLGNGVSKKEAERVNAAWNAGEIPVMFVHPKSAGHGLNFQYGGHHVIMCGPIWSLDQTKQIIARLWRRGQVHEVIVDTVITHDTVEDKVMLPRLTGKREVTDDFMAHLTDV